MAKTLQQLRVRFSGVDEEITEPDSIKGHRIHIHKGQSFKEKKGGIKWLGKQISNLLMSTSSGYESSEDGEFEAAVAAAAYAITMLEEYNSKSQTSSERLEITPSKLGGRKELTTGPQQTGGLSRLSQKALKEDKQYAGDLSTASASQSGGLSKRLSWKASKEDKQSAGKSEIVTDGTEPANKEPAIPTVQKAPTLTEKRKIPDDKLKPTDATVPEFTKKWNAMSYSINKEKKAASWEKAKLADIKKRYEKVLETIRSWEVEKKQKAKSRLEKRQRDLEQKKARAITEYHNQISMINKIAGGARFQAEERRKNEEIAAKEKANKIRLTGEVPRACFCF